MLLDRVHLRLLVRQLPLGRLLRGSHQADRPLPLGQRLGRKRGGRRLLSRAAEAVVAAFTLRREAVQGRRPAGESLRALGI